VQVTLMADAVTKLAAPDVFYFGNAIGESGNSPGNTTVDSADELAARANRTGLGTAAITNLYDYNRDKRVDTADQLIARSQIGGPALQLFTAPGSGAGAGAESIIVDTLTAAPTTTLTTAPALERRPLVDAALAALFAAPDPAATFTSPLVASKAPLSGHSRLIDDALLTDVAAGQHRVAQVQHQLIDRAWDTADDASSETSDSRCDHADSGVDTALTIDRPTGQLGAHQSRRRGGAT
jgi:hypothetical protein